MLYCTLCCVFVYFYFNPAFGLQLSLIKLSCDSFYAVERLSVCYACELMTGSPVTWSQVGVVWRSVWSALRRLYLLLLRWTVLSLWRCLRGVVVDNDTGRVVYTPPVTDRLIQLFTSSLSYSHLHLAKRGYVLCRLQCVINYYGGGFKDYDMAGVQIRLQRGAVGETPKVARLRRQRRRGGGE